MAAAAAETVAPGSGAVLLVVAGARSGLSFVGVGTAAVALPPQLAHDVEEGLLDVDTVLGGGLEKVTAQLLGQGLALLCGHLALGDAVTLVSDQHDWGVPKDGHGGAHGRAGVGRRAGHGRLLDALDLAVEPLDALKGRARRDAVHEHEALAVTYPLVAQGNVLLLAGRVEHLEHARLAVNLHLLAVRVLDGGVVRLDEVVEAQLARVSVGRVAVREKLPGWSGPSCPRRRRRAPPACTASFCPP
jgi:hypothetical protein